MNILIILKKLGLKSKCFVIGCWKFLKNNFFRLISFFSSFMIVFSFLFSPVFARTVDVTNIEDFFVGARFGSYSSYPDQSYADDVYYLNFGSTGMYQDTLSAEFLPSSQFDNLIVEDGFGVYYCYLYGNTPVQTLKKGSTLEITIEISFNNPLMYFQPTNCHFTLYPSVSNIENIAYSGDVNFDYVSTEGYENYFGDQSLAPKTRSAFLSFTFTAPEDIPLSHHTLTFVNNYLPNQYYQFTNDFYCSFDYLNFHYIDDETEVISTITQNTDRILSQIDQSTQDLIDSMSPDHLPTDPQDDLFNELSGNEEELLNQNEDGLNVFDSVLGSLNGYLADNTILLPLKFLSSTVTKIAQSSSWFQVIFNYAIIFGTFSLLLGLAFSLLSKSKYDSTKGSHASKDPKRWKH